MTNIFQPRTMRFLSLLSLVLISLTGCGGKGDAPSTRRNSSSRSNVPVEVLVLQPQVLEEKIFATGSLLANEEIELRSEISGRVTGVYFQEGKRVKKGELLLKINDRELKAQLKGKEVEEKQATDEEQRKQKLFDIKVISQEEYDKVLNTLKMVQAEREAIESKLAETEIMAPFDGVIGLRYISEGGYVTPDVLVATMQDIDPMKVEFSVPEKYARQMKNGTEVIVRVGDSQNDYKGEVYAVESKIDADTRTMKSRAKIPNPDASLVPGSFAKVEIILGQVTNAIVVPSGAVIPEMSGEKVYLCVNGKAKSVPVKTGIRTESGIQITAGLNAQDTLITTGLLQLADGKGVELKSTKGN